ncbi:MAG: amidohydrolase [Bryobacteraceae bacterium]|nr:amidohydrolase [Bryobacteraceae bacterium]
MHVLYLLLYGGILAAQPADLILHNGKIVTVNAGFEVVQAVAVRGERILAAGSNEAMMRRKGPSTRLIDLKGKTVLPGLMDSHTHAVDAAMYEFDHDIGDMETIADVLAYFRSRAKVVPKGEWITLRQVFMTRLREQRYPTRKELDEAAPDHPALFGTGPDASLNSLALKRNSITREKHPAESTRARIERDARTGEPTGILRSSAAFVKVTLSGKAPSLEDRIRRFKMLMADYNSVGITSIADRDASDSDVDVYRALKQQGGLTTRVFINYHIEPNDGPDKVEAQIRKAAADPLHKYDSMVWLRGVKAYLDGGMLTGSAYMREPWGVSRIYSITDPNYRGLRYIEPDPLYHAARLALKNELQFTAHSVGDGAVNALITAYERINKEFPVRPHRPCITHCNFMFPEAIDRMAAIGVVADLQPAWLERDGATLRKQFGDPRLRFFQPYKSLFSKNVAVGGGSDHMQKIGGLRSINPYNPFFGMWITLARQPRWTDQPLHTVESLTREQAIRLYTINNAFVMFEEKNKGSLEAGKFADMIVLDRDILTCPLDQVKSIQVEQTWLGGRQVFGK